MHRRAILSLAAAAAVLAAAVLAGAAARPASATAPPVGPLPRPSVTKVTTSKGGFVTIALPRRQGYDWRIARPVKASVLRETTEGDVGPVVVIVFRAVGRGAASVIVAQTRGERPKAYRAVRYDVVVR